jgi:putative ABC transport system permease protein
MSLWGLVKRSLGFYWRTNLGVLLAVAAGTAVLTGALAVGDSMRHSLLMMVAARLGDTQLALVPQNRFFRDELADELSAELDAIVAPVLNLRGTITTSDGTKRANRVEVLGVDERFFQVGGGANPFGSDRGDVIVVNRGLAAELGVEPDDEVVLRIAKPGLLPRDAPLSLDTDLSAAFRLRMKAVAGRAEFGRFDLQANHVAPLNAFVPIRWLQEKLGRVGQANMILVAASRRGEITVDRANEAVSRCWQLADAALELRELEKQDVFEIRSKRIFIEDSLAQAAMDVANGSIGVLTYFVNEFRLGERTTPYAVVCAMERSADVNGLIPVDMRADEILINEWLAEDLEASVGDVIELSYFVIGPMRKLQEAKSSFRVRGILPMEGTAVDPELMPDYPGLAEVRNCRDWEPGIPIDLSKIRKRDEDYWDKYRGTPKAFVTLEAGQMLWGNRYGNLTAVRYPRGDKSKQGIAGAILSKVDPASVGLFFQSVRARGIRAGNEATDFGQLFLGFNMFIILAAVVLMALVFVFGVENRSEQVGMLLAVGFTPKQVGWLLFVEGGILAVLGAVAGTVLGLLYTKAMIYGLVTLWRAATSNAEIHFSVKPSTLAIGAAGGVVISLIAIWLTLRKQVSRPARELLAGNLRWQFFVSRSVSKAKIGLLVTMVSAAGAVVLLVAVGTGDSSTAPMAFFGAGALLLVAGLGLGHALLRVVRGGWFGITQCSQADGTESGGDRIACIRHFLGCRGGGEQTRSFGGSAAAGFRYRGICIAG